VKTGAWKGTGACQGHMARVILSTSPSSCLLGSVWGGQNVPVGGVLMGCARKSHLSDSSPNVGPPINMPAMKIDWAISFSLPELHTKSHCTRARKGQPSSVQPSLPSHAQSATPHLCSLSHHPGMASLNLAPASHAPVPPSFWPWGSLGLAVGLGSLSHGYVMMAFFKFVCGLLRLLSCPIHICPQPSPTPI
jgi:hypothetical protein